MVRYESVESHSLYKIKIFKTFNITQSAEGDKEGKWTSVVAMAVLLQ